MTTPELLAIASSTPGITGAARCFWCGCKCRPHSYQPPGTFNGWADVRCASSRDICAGCRIATDESDTSQRPRIYSYVITANSIVKTTKGDLSTLRNACLNPPPPPYAIALAVSGQKHLLYRTPVNRSRDIIAVQLELEAVTYRPAELAERIDIATRVVAATGKPALLDPEEARVATALSAHYRDPEPGLRWLDLWSQPLSRLAAFLCPNKEIAQHEYPSEYSTGLPDVRCSRVPATTGGPDGPGLFG